MTCDFTNYPSFKALSVIDSGQVQNVRHLVAHVASAAGVNQFHVFTGFAVLDFRPTDDDVLRYGSVTIDLNFVLKRAQQLHHATATAGLSSYWNEAEHATGSAGHLTHAVDCVAVEPVLVQGPGGTVTRLILMAAIAVSGPGGYASVERLAYQVNALMEGD